MGTLPSYQVAAVEDYFREIIVGRLNDTLGEAGIGLLELPAHYDEVAADLARRVEHDLAGYGLELEKLLIAAITPPEEVARVIDERSGMAAVGMGGRYMGFKAARALGDAAAGGGGSSAGEGMGLGVGAGLGMAMPGLIREALDRSGTVVAAEPSVSGEPACPACGKPIEADARFCRHCGRKTAGGTCSGCGGVHPAGARFCPRCGHRLGE
ncbi:MAG: SPFH domain-containing protein [Acidobacteriota bacterium]|nr:SPFH domain-containing protein [Acidobacteriota bacterium]